VAGIPKSAGLKSHFGNSDVDLDNTEHIERLQRVFRSANTQHMAIVVHLRSSLPKRQAYGPGNHSQEHLSGE